MRDDTTTFAALTILAAVSFVVAGLVAWRGRPERLTGALMIGIGFALFAGTLVAANRSLPFTFGLALSPVAAAALAHLVLAFPDGRLHSGLERFLVAAAYVNAIAVQMVMLMFMGIEHVGGCPCPRNLLFVRDDMGVHSALMNARAAGRDRDRRGRRESFSFGAGSSPRRCFGVRSHRSS